MVILLRSVRNSFILLNSNSEIFSTLPTAISSDNAFETSVAFSLAETEETAKSNVKIRIEIKYVFFTLSPIKKKKKRNLDIVKVDYFRYSPSE